MTNLSVFNFNSNEVRIVVVTGEPWFVASDVCSILENSNPSQVLARLDEDEKDLQSVDTLGGVQSMLCVNESGLYSLVLTSRKPQAKEFKRWITHDVIPSIRKTGSYSIKPKSRVDALLETVMAIKEHEDKILALQGTTNELDNRLGVLEAEQSRYKSPGGYKYTILGYAKILGREISTAEASGKGKRASALCRQRGIELESTRDPRFGTVQLYPESVLKVIFE